MGQPRFSVTNALPGFQRFFDTAELSDGTLQYLCLLARCFRPRPPSLIAINEPETSIHPDLLVPLARLIVDASAHTQLWDHHALDAVGRCNLRDSGCIPVQLEKAEGETRVQGQSGLAHDVALIPDRRRTLFTGRLALGFIP